jgi:hypothetical protein
MIFFLPSCSQHSFFNCHLRFCRNLPIGSTFYLLFLNFVVVFNCLFFFIQMIKSILVKSSSVKWTNKIIVHRLLLRCLLLLRVLARFLCTEISFCWGESFACHFWPQWGFSGETGFVLSYVNADQFYACTQTWIERFLNKLFMLVPSLYLVRYITLQHWQICRQN